MSFRWLICLSIAACSAPAESMSVSTSVIDRPAETISTHGLDCSREVSPEQSLVAADLLQRLRSDAQRMTRELLATVRDELGLSDALAVTNEDCGEQNAHYIAETKTIRLCNELFSNVAALWFDPARTEAANQQRILGAWRYVFFHELGHALIDLYDLPIADSDEEDAVDDFSTLKLIEAGLTDDALSAAGFWRNKTRAGAPCTGFLGAHSLSEERFEAIVCLVFGSAPEALEQEVAQYELPDKQQCVCPFEFAKQSARWEQLLDGAEAPVCGYLGDACCAGSYPCRPGLTCAAASCSTAECG